VVEITQKTPLRWSIPSTISHRGAERLRRSRSADVLDQDPRLALPACRQCGQSLVYGAGLQTISKGIAASVGVQAAGAVRLVLGHPVDKPETGRHRYPHWAARARRAGARSCATIQGTHHLGHRCGDPVGPAHPRFGGCGWSRLSGGLGGLIAETGRGAWMRAGKNRRGVYRHGLKDPSVVTQSFKSPR